MHDNLSRPRSSVVLRVIILSKSQNRLQSTPLFKSTSSLVLIYLPRKESESLHMHYEKAYGRKQVSKRAQASKRTHTYLFEEKPAAAALEARGERTTALDVLNLDLHKPTKSNE